MGTRVAYEKAFFFRRQDRILLQAFKNLFNDMFFITVGNDKIRQTIQRLRSLDVLIDIAPARNDQRQRIARAHPMQHLTGFMRGNVCDRTGIDQVNIRLFF